MLTLARYIVGALGFTSMVLPLWKLDLGGTMKGFTCGWCHERITNETMERHVPPCRTATQKYQSDMPSFVEGLLRDMEVLNDAMGKET